MDFFGAVYIGFGSAIRTAAQRECCGYLSPMSSPCFSTDLDPIERLFWKAYGYGHFLIGKEKFADQGSSYIYRPSLRIQSERKPIR